MHYTAVSGRQLFREFKWGYSLQVPDVRVGEDCLNKLARDISCHVDPVVSERGDDRNMRMILQRAVTMLVQGDGAKHSYRISLRRPIPMA